MVDGVNRGSIVPNPAHAIFLAEKRNAVSVTKVPELGVTKLGRPSAHGSSAERQKAYRDRLRQQAGQTEQTKPNPDDTPQ